VFEPPSASHWFGLDDSGYDMTSLLIEGTKVSLIVGFAATLVSMVIGGGSASPLATSAAASTPRSCGSPTTSW
jgi:ABC-type dipeptide/oligopeptide/nickel transport system permease subunit